MRVVENLSSLSSRTGSVGSAFRESGEGFVYGADERSPGRRSRLRIEHGGAVDGVPVALRVAATLGGRRMMRLGLTADRVIVGDRCVSRLSADAAARYRGALAALLAEAAKVPGLLVTGYRYPEG